MLIFERGQVSGASVNNVSERMIVKEGNVKVINLTATFGTKTYTVLNIGFARMRVKEPNFFLPVFFAVTLGICSFLIAISNLEEYSQFLQVGLFGGIAGTLFFLCSRKTKYSVQIRSGVGELSVLETGDRNCAARIVKAVHEAIGK